MKTVTGDGMIYDNAIFANSWKTFDNFYVVL